MPKFFTYKLIYRMVHAFKKLLPLFCLFLIVSSTGWGQNLLKNSDDFVNKHKWDVSLDAYNLLKSGNAVVLLRYQPRPNYGAVRLAVGFLATKTNSEGILDSTSNLYHIFTQSYVTYTLRAGYEFHKQKGRFLLFYGPEIYHFREKTVSEYPPHFKLVSGGELSSPIITVQYAVGGIVGLKYFLSKRLSISSETIIRYQFQNAKSYLGKGILGAQTKTNSIQFNPLYAFNLSFHF